MSTLLKKFPSHLEQLFFRNSSAILHLVIFQKAVASLHVNNRKSMPTYNQKTKPRKKITTSYPIHPKLCITFDKSYYYPQHILTAFSHINRLWTNYIHTLYFLWIKQEKPLHSNGLFDIIVVFSPWIDLCV